MSFEKQSDVYDDITPTRGCALCGSDATKNQAEYGAQAAEQRKNTNKGSASSCSCQSKHSATNLRVIARKLRSKATSN